MPPAIFVDEVSGVAGDDAATMLFPGPLISKPRDTHLAIIVCDADCSYAGDDGEWEQLAKFAHASTDPTVVVCRRTATDASIPPLVMNYPPLFAHLLVFRGLNPGAPLGSSSSIDVAASTNFACPSRVLAAYSDLYLGIAVAKAAVAVTAPAGTTSRAAAAASGHGVNVFSFLLEAPGATGTKTATTAGAQSGIAASLALPADALVGFGKSFTFDPSGAPGLPLKGI